MSITSRINEMSSHIEQAYDELQGLGADLTNVDKNIENISMVLDDIYDSMPQVSGEGTSLTLDDTRVGKIKSTLKGNTSQDGTPTPTTPQPVNVVSGDNKINVVGKNLFDKSTLTANSWLIENGSVSLNHPDYSVSDFIGIEPNTSYYKLKSGSPRIKYYDRHQQPLNTTTYQDIDIGGGAGTFTTPNDAYFLRLTLHTDEVSVDTYQLEKGSSATSYEPYQGNTYNIDLPVENLLSASEHLYGTSNGIKTTYSEGEYNISGTASASWAYIANNVPINIPAGAYTLSLTKALPFRIFVTFTHDNGNTSTLLINSGSTIGTYTLTRQVVKYELSVSRMTSGTTYNETLGIQLQKGSEVTNYTPYGKTPIELCKIGDYQDYFYKEGKKWYLHKEIGKVVLNGTETISSYDATSLSGSYQATFEITTKATSTDKIVLSDYFTSALLSDRTTKTNICYTYTDGLLRIATNLATTMADFKTWLSNHNTSVYYQLATPTNTEITYQPLIDQLNELEKAMSKDGQTNISQVNNDLPFIISASALKEWQENTSLNSTLSMVNPLSLGNTLNTQEIDNNTQPIEVDNIEPLEEEENEES